MTPINIRQLNDRISYIESSENPLSSNVGIILGDNCMYFYDVGSNSDVLSYLNSIDKKKVFILSHFHQDHITNIKRINNLSDCQIYLGNNTYKYVKTGNIVTEKIMINDGVKLEIIPVSSTHAKGSVILNVNNECTFVGDATYMTMKGEHAVYNVQMLKELIDLLKSLDTKYLLLSHDEKFIYEKAEVIENLEGYYKKREKVIHI